MDSSGFSGWADLISQGGLVGGLLLAFWTGARKVWVWGYLYFDVVKDRDEWKALALDGLQTAQSAVKVAEGSVSK